MKKIVQGFNRSIPIFLMLIINSSLFAQDYTEVAKLVADNRSSEARFGSPVAILSSTVMVGAYYESYNSNDQDSIHCAGAVYVFNRQENGDWEQVQKIVAPDREADDFFGVSLSISGNYAFIGALYEDHDASGGNEVSNSGSAYIYKFEDGSWHFMQKLTAPLRAADDMFGASVCISGKYAIAGAYAEDENEQETESMDMAGAAYIFELKEGGSWDLIQKVVASDRQAYAAFAGDIGMDSTMALIGALDETKDEAGEDPLNNAGAVYVFRRDNEGIWNQVQKIVASDRGAENRFGGSVSISGGYAVVGASGNDTDSNGDSILPRSGSAYIFEQNDSGLLIQVKKITASDRKEGASYGTSVGIDKDIIIVNAYNEYLDSEGNDSLANAGAVYLIGKIDGNWEEVQKITASDREADDYFGSTAISGNCIIIGASCEDEDASGNNTLSNAGSVYVFENGRCIPSLDRDTANILLNGDFGSCDISPWDIYLLDPNVNTLNAELVDGELVLTGITPGAENIDWHVQLLQNFTQEQLNRMEEGSIYRLSFDARAIEKEKELYVFLGQNSDDWFSYINQNSMVGLVEEHFSFAFILSSISLAERVLFGLGNESTGLILDNVRLVKVADPVPVISSDRFERVRVYPNPASDVIEIAAKQPVMINIFNSLGLLVKTQNINEDLNTIDITDLEEGLFFVTIRGSDYSMIEKIVINR